MVPLEPRRYWVPNLPQYILLNLVDRFYHRNQVHPQIEVHRRPAIDARIPVCHLEEFKLVPGTSEVLRIPIRMLSTASSTSTLQEFTRDLSYLQKGLCMSKQSVIFHNYTAYDHVQNVSYWSNLCPKIHGPNKFIIKQKASIVVVFTVQRI